MIIFQEVIKASLIQYSREYISTTAEVKYLIFSKFSASHSAPPFISLSSLVSVPKLGERLTCGKKHIDHVLIVSPVLPPLSVTQRYALGERVPPPSRVTHGTSL